MLGYAKRIIRDRTGRCAFVSTAAQIENSSLRGGCIIILAGQYYDQETGLHYNYFRYYDPASGRYITSDPIGIMGHLRRGGLYEINDGGYNALTNNNSLTSLTSIGFSQFGGDLNLYVYTSGNPINRTDPRGDYWQMIAPVAICGGFYIYYKGIQACGKKFPNHGDLTHPDYAAYMQCVSNITGVIGLGMGMSSDPLGTAAGGVGGAAACDNGSQCP